MGASPGGDAQPRADSSALTPKIRLGLVHVHVDCPCTCRCTDALQGGNIRLLFPIVGTKNVIHGSSLIIVVTYNNLLEPGYALSPDILCKDANTIPTSHHARA